MSSPTTTNFDWQFYVSFYEDLSIFGINTWEKALNHWIQSGKNEGRICEPPDSDFDWEYYLAQYADLKMYGINTKRKATEHWIHIGKKNGLIGHSGRNVAVQKEDEVICPEHAKKESEVTDTDTFASATIANDEPVEDNFDWKYYTSVYSDLTKNGIDTQEKAFEHWINNGKLEGRKCTVVDKTNFDWESYISIYTDLRNAGINTRQKALTHWTNHGKSEIRAGYNYIKNYPYLFHKYLLQISDPTKPIAYKTIKKSKSNNKFACHLHCYDMDTFYEIYGEYLNNLLDEFNVIVTYCIGAAPELLLKRNLSIIKIQNKGRDIGAKICVLNFLENEKNEYNYILFLHSKTNKNRRLDYFSPLVKDQRQIKLIKSKLLNNDKLLGIFPNLLSTYYKYNLKYYKELLSFLNIDNDELNEFAEGNCFICKKSVTDFIFKDKHEFLYNMLNQDNSFDLNWFSFYYDIYNKSIKSNYNRYVSENMLGNNDYNIIMINSNCNELKKIYNFPDAMIEHIYERIWFNVIKHLGGHFLILDKT